jgi:hypothetical protein
MATYSIGDLSRREILKMSATLGAENTGFAIANDELLWIDPMDYRDQLAEAVDVLTGSKVCVSVYNLPRCVLAQSVWPYSAQRRDGCSG